MDNDWIIYIRDRELNRYAEVDDYRKFEVTLKFNDIGKWSLEIDRRSKNLVPLMTPGFGIQVMNRTTKEMLFSGYIDERDYSWDATNDTLTVNGWDDNKLLDWRLSCPSPGESFPPYTVQAFDQRSGVASTVIRAYVNANLGPGAVASRQWPGVIMGTDPIVGSTIQGKLRWTKLLPDMQGLAIAGGGLGFRCIQVDSNIQFQVYMPKDKTADVKFSVHLGNLVGGKVKTVSPEATYVYVGGDGEGTARKIREGKDDGAHQTWGRREVFEDNSGTNNDTELDQKIKESLADKSEQAEFEVQITDTEALKFGVDYNLGDKVTAIFVGSEANGEESPPGTPLVGPVFEGGQVQEVIREIRLTLAEDGVRVVPMIGTPTKSAVFRLMREIRRIQQRIANLETYR